MPAVVKNCSNLQKYLIKKCKAAKLVVSMKICVIEKMAKLFKMDWTAEMSKQTTNTCKLIFIIKDWILLNKLDVVETIRKFKKTNLSNCIDETLIYNFLSCLNIFKGWMSFVATVSRFLSVHSVMKNIETLAGASSVEPEPDREGFKQQFIRASSVSRVWIVPFGIQFF